MFPPGIFYKNTTYCCDQKSHRLYVLLYYRDREFRILTLFSKVLYCPCRSKTVDIAILFPHETFFSMIPYKNDLVKNIAVIYRCQFFLLFSETTIYGQKTYISVTYCIECISQNMYTIIKHLRRGPI